MLFAQTIKQPKGWNLDSVLSARWKSTVCLQKAQFVFHCKLPSELKHLSPSVQASFIQIPTSSLPLALRKGFPPGTAQQACPREQPFTSPSATHAGWYRLKGKPGGLQP